MNNTSVRTLSDHPPVSFVVFYGDFAADVVNLYRVTKPDVAVTRMTGLT